MNDDDKPKYHITSTPRQAGKSFFQQWFEENAEIPPDVWIGVDWAKDSGMNRGDVIKRNGNVAHVRFRTVAD